MVSYGPRHLLDGPEHCLMANRMCLMAHGMCLTACPTCLIARGTYLVARGTCSIVYGTCLILPLPSPPSPTPPTCPGIEIQDFAQILVNGPSSVYLATGASLSVASGRLSFALGLHGPCAAYVTACSASLVGYHAARRGVQMGECQGAIATGVNMMLLPGASPWARRHDICVGKLPYLRRTR